MLCEHTYGSDDVYVSMNYELRRRSTSTAETDFSGLEEYTEADEGFLRSYS